MNKEILIRYSELTLKGKNRKEFINLLVSSLEKKLKAKELEYKLEKTNDRLIILPQTGEIEDYFSVIKKVSGISWYAEMLRFETTRENIHSALDQSLEGLDAKTFRISAKAIDKKLFESSNNLTSFIAGHVLSNYNLKVNLDHHDIEINIKLLENGQTLLYIERIKGIIGLPSGTAGKTLTMLSGGIDSPVAAYKMITRGSQSSFVTFLTNETGNPEVLHKIKSLANKVNEYNNTNGNLYLVNFTRVQAEIAKLPNESYRITILRRFYLRFSEIIARRYGYKSFVTGDALGQVASQTVESMTVVSEIADRIIFRPLVAMPKDDIVNIAREIETLDLSNLPGDDMCSRFAPDKPIIHPKLDEVKDLESKIENISELLAKVLEEDMRVVKLGK